MIDLSISIRKYLLTITGFTDIISDYNTSKAIFNFRPVPEDAQYPMSVVQPASGGGDTDFLNCFKRSIPYHVFVYNKNSEPYDLIKIDEAANLVARSFHRMDVTKLEQSGFKIVSVTASNPFPAPADDNETVARAITLNFEVKY